MKKFLAALRVCVEEEFLQKNNYNKIGKRKNRFPIDASGSAKQAHSCEVQFGQRVALM